MSEPQQFQISLIWPNVDELPVVRANQFLGQLGQGPSGKPEEFVLTVGYFAPPVLLGTPQEQQASLNAMGAVAVKGLARVSMSRARMDELIQILQTVAQQYDQAVGEQ